LSQPVKNALMRGIMPTDSPVNYFKQTITGGLGYDAPTADLLARSCQPAVGVLFRQVFSAHRSDGLLGSSSSKSSKIVI
jgi:hypothetical protein